MTRYPSRTRGTLRLGAILGLVAGFAAAGPVAAWQAPGDTQPGLSDARWAAFVGCWEPLDAPAEEVGLLCVRPAGGGVEMYTVSEGEVRTSDVLVADGSPRTLSAEGCEGTETVRFSEDGRRAFTRSEIDCAGVTQRGTGVLSMVGPGEWLDVRSLEVDGERTAWVQRYRLVGQERATEEGVADASFGMETAARLARTVAHRGVGFDEVAEAAGQVDSEAVAAWLAARGEGFDVTADELERLAEAGVDASVIDVMVAVSYPERFRVDAAGEAELAEREALGAPGYGRYGTARRSLYYGPRGPFGYRMFGYGFGYLPTDAFGYGYGYGYPGYWGYRPGVVIIRPRDSGPAGRVVRGGGYQRDGAGEGRAARPRSAPSGGERPSVAPPRRSGGEASPAPSRDDPPARRPARRRPPGD